MFRCSECFLVDYASKTISDEGMIYMNCLRLVESVDFHIKIVQIRGRMQPAEAKQVHAVFSFEKSEWKAYHPSENIAIRVKASWPSEKLPSEWNFGQGVQVHEFRVEKLLSEWEISLDRLKDSKSEWFNQKVKIGLYGHLDDLGWKSVQHESCS